MSTTTEPAGSETNLDAIAAQIKQFEKDTDYLQAHWEEWKEKYPDHYVLGEKLISASTDLKEAIRLAESRGVRPGHGTRILLNRHLGSDTQVSHMAIAGKIPGPTGRISRTAPAGCGRTAQAGHQQGSLLLVDTGPDNTTLRPDGVARSNSADCRLVTEIEPGPYSGTDDCPSRS